MEGCHFVFLFVEGGYFSFLYYKQTFYGGVKNYAKITSKDVCPVTATAVDQLKIWVPKSRNVVQDKSGAIHAFLKLSLPNFVCVAFTSKSAQSISLKWRIFILSIVECFLKLCNRSKISSFKCAISFRMKIGYINALPTAGSRHFKSAKTSGRIRLRFRMTITSIKHTSTPFSPLISSFREFL